MYDYIVIGAGYGGVSAAGLLQKHGYKVLILEAHSLVGGCASYFKRKNFLFDVGATTFSGVLGNQPLGKLFKELEISPVLKKIDPGMIIKQNGIDIIRHSDKEKWIEEVNHKFPHQNQTVFWNKVFHLDKLAWEFIDSNFKIPPRNISDLFSLVKFSNFQKIELIPNLFRSIGSKLNSYDLNDGKFRKFLDEQLLITTQSRLSEAPMLTSAMGLTYPSETYYPYGGMVRPAELILSKFRTLGGEVILKEKVTSIIRKTDGYELKTKKGNSYFTKGVISNIPIWNMAEITEGSIQKYYTSKSKKFSSAPGAFTLNFAIETKVELPTCYYQVHSRSQIPHCEAGAFFVSFSLPDDLTKSPIGFRTVTISTHTNVDEWLGLSKENYNEKKKIVEEFILSEFDYAFPELHGANKLYPLSGTPDTFEFYTHRKNGFVGGIPHSIHSSLLFMTPNVTPFHNLYMVGDTVFPGQGTPAVVLGALNVVKRILS